jgi:membrane-associated phospholipid phosphatase
MNSLAPSISIRSRWGAVPRFDRLMAFATAAVLAITFAGCRLTLIHIPDIAAAVLGTVLLIPIILLIPIYWHEKGKIELRDAALTIPWCLIFRSALVYSIAIGGRLGMNIPLRDEYFARLDHSLGVSVPEIMAWSSHHWFGNLASSTYALLFPMLWVAYMLPALTGKVKQAQQFITSNLIVFAVGVPLFCLFPAVGPWYGYHLPANPVQAACQLSLFSLRASGPYCMQLYGVVCFPSFHVIWVLVCANSLWCFKLLRIPVAILSTLIILSTMTGGWHYFVDVLAGLLVAVAAIAASRALSRWHTPVTAADGNHS